MYLSQTRPGAGWKSEDIAKVTSVTRYTWKGTIVASEDHEVLGDQIWMSRNDCSGWRIKHLISEIDLRKERQ